MPVMHTSRKKQAARSCFLNFHLKLLSGFNLPLICFIAYLLNVTVNMYRPDRRYPCGRTKKTRPPNQADRSLSFVYIQLVIGDIQCITPASGCQAPSVWPQLPCRTRRQIPDPLSAARGALKHSARFPGGPVPCSFPVQNRGQAF